MFLKISKKTIFYILCPSNLSTGGPKHLHQLGFELKNLKKKTYIFYYPSNNKIHVHKNYRKYNLPFVKEIKDTKENIIIVPEVHDAIKISKKYKNIQKVLFWMSLDFFILSNFQSLSKYIKSIIKIPYRVISFFNEITKNNFGNVSFARYLKFLYLNLPFVNLFKKNEFRLNLSQSYYQEINLKKKGVKSKRLNDFIQKDFFLKAKKIDLKKKENLICYNPLKSSEFMKRIIKHNSDFKFVPLINLTISEVIDILSKSKIYMDFGFHPGVDGLPRESAILKNCIITNKEGSAYYSKAVPISKKYKFEEKKKNLIKIRNLIKKIFKNHKNELQNFKNYLSIIEKEEFKFKSQVAKIFD